MALFAEEYVLGLLDPAEAAEAEALIASDTAFAEAVAAAQERFLPLDATAAAEAPAADLWSKIEAGLDDAPQAAPDAPTAPETSDAAAPLPPPMPSRGRDVAPRPGHGPWRSAALAAIAASVILAIGLGWMVASRPDPAVVAVLLNDQGRPFALVSGTEDNRTEITILSEADIPPGQVMQVWTKPDPDGPPVSLGTLPGEGGFVLDASGLPSPTADQLYEITVEQLGGSPTGGPTGPILGKGLAQVPQE